MTVDQPPVQQSARRRPFGRAKLAIWIGALVVGFGIGGIVSLLSKKHGGGSAEPQTSYTTWKAGERPAPALSLTDENGKPLVLSSLKGKQVVVTFIDPLCRNFCPREARVISDAVRATAPTATIVSVSTNPWADTRQNFAADKIHWNLGAQWRWGVGTRAELADVWKRYQVAVRVDTKTVAGITIHEITHTGAAYVLDATGHERALLLWPFTQAQLTAALRVAVPG